MTDKMNDLGFDAYKYDPGLWIHRGQLLVATTHADNFQAYDPHRRCADLWGLANPSTCDACVEHNGAEHPIWEVHLAHFSSVVPEWALYLIFAVVWRLLSLMQALYLRRT